MAFRGTLEDDIGQAARWLKYVFDYADTAQTKRLARWTATGIAGWEAGRRAYKAYQKRRTYTVAVPSSDDIYTDLHRWVLDHLGSKDRKALEVKSILSGSSNRFSESIVDDGRRPRKRREGSLLMFYDGSVTQHVAIGGHRISVTVEKEDSDQADTYGNMVVRIGPPRERIVFRMKGTDARDSVLTFLAELTKDHHNDPEPRVFIIDGWRTEWNRANAAIRRPLSSVILPAGQSERIVDDLDTFLAMEHHYVELGIPWHRGYLFYGPPGTGKTSMAKALAEHFDMDCYVMPVGDIKADTNLLSLFSEVNARSLLVLEDIDVAHASHSRDDAEAPEKVSLSGLLNALDGITTPHGLVTIMTTNDKSVLDPALVRPGRTDLLEEFGYLDTDQLHRLFCFIVGESPGIGSLSCPPNLSHAEVVEALKPHLGDREGCVKALMDLRNGRLREFRPTRGYTTHKPPSWEDDDARL